MGGWFDVLGLRPPLGWGWTLLVLGLAGVGVVWSGVREWGLHGRGGWWWVNGLRLLVLVGLAGVLGGPGVWVDEDEGAGGVPVVVLADTSGSMGVCDAGGETRWGAVAKRWLDEGFLGRVREAGGEVRVYGFDAGVRGLGGGNVAGLVPGGEQTRLKEAVAGAARGGRAGVVLLLSDGRDTGEGVGGSGGGVGGLVGDGWRVASVGVGDASRVPDVGVLAWGEADVVVDGQSTVIRAMVSHRGYSGRAVWVRVREAGRVVGERRVELGETGWEAVSFEIEPRRGVGRGPWVRGYEVTAELEGVGGEGDGEAVVENNRRWVFVRVGGEKVRVLLVDGRPYWDSKFVGRVLGEDAGVSLRAVYGVGAGRWVEVVRGGGLPGEGAGDAVGDLSRYDVVMLGGGCERFFDGDGARRLVEFVRGGGGSLVLLRGRAFGEGSAGREVLGGISPVEWGRGEVGSLRLWATRAGAANPVTGFERMGGADAVLTRLPGMLAATRVGGERAASVVLLRQGAKGGAVGGEGGMPGVVYQRVGAGKVFAVLGEGMWRWAMLPRGVAEGGRVLDGAYRAFWTRAVRWLALGDAFLPGSDYGLTLGRVGVEPGQAVSVNAVSRGAGGVGGAGGTWRVAWVKPGGERALVGLERASEQGAVGRATVRPELAGVHEFVLQTRDDSGAWVGRASGRVAVYERSMEMLDTSADPGLLASMSEATGGLSLGLDDMDEFVGFVRGLSVARGVSPRWVYRFDRGWLLGLLGVLVVSQWVVGRRGGLA